MGYFSVLRGIPIATPDSHRSGWEGEYGIFAVPPSITYRRARSLLQAIPFLFDGPALLSAMGYKPLNCITSRRLFASRSSVAKPAVLDVSPGVSPRSP